MIKAISRQQVFELSRMADIAIAERQQFYFKQFDGENPAVITAILPVYDHRIPLFKNNNPKPEFCVLAYDEDLNGTSYEKGFALAFSKLLSCLQIGQVMMLQDLCHSWDEFGFNTKKDLRQFKKLVAGETGKTGFILDHRSLQEIIPLLFHSNPDQGDCSFYTATGDIPLAILYWKGNLHVLFYQEDLARLAAAAKEAKLVMGSRELSLQYRFGQKLV